MDCVKNQVNPYIKIYLIQFKKKQKNLQLKELIILKFKVEQIQIILMNKLMMKILIKKIQIPMMKMITIKKDNLKKIIDNHLIKK